MTTNPKQTAIWIVFQFNEVDWADKIMAVFDNEDAANEYAATLPTNQFRPQPGHVARHELRTEPG